MKSMLVPLFISPPMLLLAAIIPVMTRLNSVTVISYRQLRKTKNGPTLCALDLPNETMSHDRQQCSLWCGRDSTCTGYNINNSPSHSPVITWIHLYWIQHQQLTQSLTCDHMNTPVLVTTSTTHPVTHLWSRQYTCTGYNINNSPSHSPVITSIHLYWLQPHELTQSPTCDQTNTTVLATTSTTHAVTHLWSREYTCTGNNITNSPSHSPVITWIHLYWLQHQQLTQSLTCDHINTPVLATTSRTHPVTHLWSRRYTCAGYNINNSRSH